MAAYNPATWQKRKRASHRRILAAAGRHLRKDGIDGLSVGEVMADAGLTHGGFYAHFDNKQALVKDAFTDAADEARDMWFERLDDIRGAESLKWLAGRYLRPRHREHLEDSCLFAALSMDAARDQPSTRDVFDKALGKTVAAVAAKLDQLPAAEARSQAIVFLSLCIGALNLSRAVAGEEFSDEILRTARQFAASLAPPTET